MEKTATVPESAALIKGHVSPYLLHHCSFDWTVKPANIGSAVFQMNKK
jgi:hypothetical protein